MTGAPILVTGAGGRIGTALRRQAGADLDVVAVTRSPLPGSRSIDVTDPEAVDGLLAEVKPRAVVHLAALTGAACDADPAAAERINVGGTAHLAQAARRHGVTRFVLASTAAVYGDARRRPLTESDAPSPSGAYATTKLRAEEALAATADQLPSHALRVFNVYGPGMRDSLVTRLFTASRERPVRLNGLDGFVRDYVHVDDVARAVLAAAESPDLGFRVLNVGSGVPRRNRDLWEVLPAAARAAVEVGPEVDSYSCADITAITDQLGWLPSATWPPTPDSFGP